MDLLITATLFARPSHGNTGNPGNPPLGTAKVMPTYTSPPGLPAFLRWGGRFFVCEDLPLGPTHSAYYYEAMCVDVEVTPP